MRLWAILPAAGAGVRLGLGFNKVLAPLGGQPLLYRTLEAVTAWPGLEGVVLVHAAGERGLLEQVVGLRSWPWPVRWAEGGATRAASVRAGMQEARTAGATWLAVHDAARPFASAPLVAAIVARAREAGAAIPGVAVADTVKRLEPGSDRVVETVPRDGLCLVQTPQVVRLDDLRAAYEEAGRAGFEGTDEASLLEAAGLPVVVVEGDPDNLKVTGPGDLDRADRIGLRLGRWSAPPDSGPTP